MYKQVIIVRNDLKMPKGKLAIQCCHASVESALKSDKKNILEWKKNGMKKVVLKADDENAIIKYFKMAKALKLNSVIIKDSGKTFFKEPTITCIGIGPDEESRIDKVSGNLKMI